MLIDQLPPELFTWSRWRKGGEFLADNKISCTNGDLLMRKHRANIKKYGIGYCNAENLQCRPKLGHKAVMLWIGEHIWFHVTDRELKTIIAHGG